MAYPALKKLDPASPQGRLAQIGLGAAFLIGLGAALQIIELLVGRSPLGSALLGAVAADIVAGYAGVRWDTDTNGMPAKAAGDTASAIQRSAIGIAAATAALLITLAVAGSLGWISIEAGEPSKALGLALVRGGAVGVREELFLRGIILLTAARVGVRPLVGAIFAALAGGAAIAFDPGSGPGAVILAVGSGFLFATLWQWQRGAWAAVAAHGFWVFLLGAAIRGGVVDITWKQGLLTTGVRAFGGPAVVGALVCVAVAIGITYKMRRATGASPPTSDEDRSTADKEPSSSDKSASAAAEEGRPISGSEGSATEETSKSDADV